MEYKVGDKVRIIKRTSRSTDYPFLFTDTMAGQAGNIYEIDEIRKSSDPTCRINGDFHSYCLKGSMNAWHSSMFEKVEESATKERFASLSEELELREKHSFKIVL